VVRTDVGRERVTFHAADGATAPGRPAVPPAVGPSTLDGFAPGPLLEHVARERVVGVLLVRLGGHAAGVFAGRRLVDSKVGSRLVHARPQEGRLEPAALRAPPRGPSACAFEAAAEVAAGILLPHRADLEALVLGGDRRALASVMEDPRLRALAPLGQERVLDVPRPPAGRPAATPERFLSTVLRPSG
jgi:hypothetical protein